MSDLILHHYALSPFSEKVRALLGYCNLPWHSAITREMPPRPVLQALAGGYRKIPVAQAGADIFCDTATIATEIAVRAGKPELAPQNCSDEVKQFIAAVEMDVFFACVFASASWSLHKKVLKTLSLLELVSFFADRIKMGRTAAVRIVKPGQAPTILRQHLQDMETRLQQDFLFGAEPNIADFAAYHSLWMVRDAGEKNTVDPYPRVMAWMDRIQGFGHGQPTAINPQQALTIARDHEPRPLAEEEQQDDLLGREVTISPADYARDATRGRLVGSSVSRWVIARETTELGTVHVHFPKPGYSLKPV
ncbi:MAG: glutathione S-transferase family protein [Pseudomonadota bacterium]|nr:glutathione S-transferase [Pseudomonadales bacterium]MDY6919383.1 glutathione S-transferase family protein [Pseudomonadota bacterium]